MLPENNDNRSSGASLVEYVLLLLLIVIGLLAALEFIGYQVSQPFSSLGSAI